MAIGFEAFDLSGKVSIEIGDSDQALIVIRRSAQSANSQLEKLEKQAVATAAAFRQLNNLQGRKVNASLQPSPSPRTPSRAPTGEDTAMRRAQADIARMQSQRFKWESDYTNHVNRQTDQQYRARVNSYQKGLREFQRTLDQQKRIEATSGATPNTGNANILASLGIIGANPYILATTAAVGGLTVGINQASQAMQRASSFDSARRGLSLYYDSADALSDKLRELEQVAKDTQGLKFLEAVQAQRNLEAAKIEAGDATKTIKEFANAMATVGGTDFQGVLTALTQIASKSQISAEEINQLAERMPQIRSAMQSVYGTSDTEVLQKRGIDPKDFINDITKALEQMPRAQKSAAGGWENFTDAVDKAYTKVGEPALPTATRILDRFTNIIENNGDTFTSWGEKLDRSLKVVEDLTYAVDYLSQTSLARLVTYLDDAAYYTSFPTLLYEAFKPLITSISDYEKAQQKANETTAKGGATAQKAAADSAAAGKQIAKTTKETYTERITALDKFYKDQLIKADAGLRQTKAAELSYQQNLLAIEKDNYNRRLDALADFYKEKLKRAKTGAEQESILSQARVEVGKGKVDFSQAQAEIKKGIEQLKADIQQQLRGDLGEGLQIALDKSSSGLETTLGDLSERFERGAISASDYWNEARKSLNDYAGKLREIRQEQLKLTLQNPALTPEQRKNEVDRAGQQYLEADRQIVEKGKGIFQLLKDFQATSDRTKVTMFDGLQSNIDEATASLLRFYKLFKENPNLVDDPTNSISTKYAAFAKNVKTTYAEFFKDAASFEEGFLLFQQSSAEKAFQTQIDYLKKELPYYSDNAKKQAEIQNEITALESQQLTLRAKNEEEYLKFKADNLEKAAEKSRRAFETLDSKIADLGGTFTSLDGRIFGAKTELQGLNEYFANPDNLTAIENYAKALGYTGEQLKSIIRQLQEGKAQQGNTRPRVVGAQPQPEFGDTVRAGLKDEFDLGNIGRATAGAQTEMEARAAATKEVYNDLGNSVVGVFGSMAGAAQSTLEAFILTGEGGADAFKQLAAQTIAAIAVQSGVKAIFETAEGFAAAARYDFVSSAAHFAAAKVYGAVALGAGAVGIGIGLAGGLSGGKKDKNSASAGSSGSGGSSNERPDYYTVQNPPPQEKSTPRYHADPTTLKLLERIEALSALPAEINGLRESVSNFDSKIGSMKEGEVLTRGIKQKRGLLSDTVMQELKGDGSKTTQFGKALRQS
jgi:tape measure domain-containing protein